MPRLLVDPGVYAADNGHSHKRVYALGIAILLTILSACGGGGGGGGTSSNPQTPPPPSTPVAITTTAVPDGTTGVNYSFVFKASGGSGIYNWSISGQTFGLSFSPSAGLLSGTSLNNGASSITVTATDSTSSTNTATKTFPFRMLVPYNWNGQTLSATAHLNAPYSLHLVLAPTASFQVTAGTLPPGMQITGSNSAGWQLSGVPTSAGTFNFTLQGSSTDNPPQLASQSFTLIVDTAFAISFPPQLPDAIFGNGYSVQLTTANTSGPVSWSAVGTPSGLSLDSATGTLSGTPAWGLAGVNELFSVTATETSTGKQAAQTFGITGFSPLGAYINAPSITLNRKFIDGVGIIGGEAPFTASVVSGSLPTGMALDRLNNIVGTPTQLGTFSFTLQITDSAHPSQTAQVPLALNVVPPRVSASTSWNGVFGITSIPVGRPFTGYVEASGGIPPFSYSSTAAPPGLSFDPNTATFSGSPITAGDYSSQIVVTDSLNSTANLTASFHIIPAKGRNDDIAHATVYNPLGSGMTGSISPYQDLNHPDNDYFLLYGRASQTITVTVSDSSSGALVPGLELLDANGNRFQTCGPQFQSPCVGHGDSSASYISLQATVPGSGNQTSPLYAHVFDWRGDSRPDMTFYISAVNNQLPLDVSQIPSTSYILSNTAQTTTPLNPVGGTFPFTWTLVSGSLPSGWVLNPGTGSITVPPSAPGTYNVVYQVADSSNPQMTAQLPMRYIVHDQLAIVQSVLPHAKVGVPYTYQFTATGGVAPFNWGISIFLPDPLSLGFPSQTGIIQFTPSVAGQAGVSAGVNSADNEFAFASFTIIIDP